MLELGNMDEKRKLSLSRELGRRINRYRHLIVAEDIDKAVGQHIRMTEFLERCIDEAYAEGVKGGRAIEEALLEQTQ